MNTKDQAFDLLIGDIQATIPGSLTGSGFHAVNCPMCKNKDESQKKGGFKFEADRIGYNCFKGSCDASTVYTLGEPIPRKFRELMETIGVKIPIELKAVSKKKRLYQEDVDDRFEKNVFKTLSFPKGFDENLTDFWAEYLIDRGCIYYDLDFRFITEGDYKGCLAVPHYFYDKLIGWVYISKSGTYITETTSSESLMLFPTKVPPKRPIVVEGVMDSLCFPNTVAVEKSYITPKQAYHLRHSDPIILPDRTGSNLYNSAKEYGWDVCVPMWKEKDLNAAVMKRGIMVVAKHIYENTMPVSTKSELLYKRWTSIK